MFENKKVIGGIIGVVALIVVFILLKNKNKAVPAPLPAAQPSDNLGGDSEGLPTNSPAFCTGKFEAVKWKRYGNGAKNFKPADWGSFATAIKVNIGKSDSSDVDIYNTLVGPVTSFFVAYDIKLSGAYVKTFEEEIIEFINEHPDTRPSEWVVGELRCDSF